MGFSVTELLFALPEPLRVSLEAVRDFLELGGDVLLVIALLLFVLWGLMLERLFYLYGAHRRLTRQALRAWEARPERRSWHAHQVRVQLVSAVSQGLERNLALIQALVALCPLLGLLGTVTGMIEVFEVMAISGSGNARSMAAGVSKATVPTMAGMVAALSGVFMSTWLQRKAQRERALLGEHMTMDH
ncbi:MAG TPA: MotA/TolQ/ExbB proton channel family protein [Gammaproteobacteria bacterium]